MKTQYKFLKISLLIASLLGGSWITYHYISNPIPSSSTQSPELRDLYAQLKQGTLRISAYNEAQDKEAVLKIFKDDWFWLSTGDYSEKDITWRLKTGSPNEYEPRFFGKMKIAVLYDHDTLAGFITYYMKNFYEGHILFLGINPTFRGKRYGLLLLDYSAQDLKNMGAKIVSLVARTTNEPGIKLYTRFGMKKTQDVHPDFYDFRKEV
jgi:ribosomal protein S18 acetylase RimI-like enzyme